MRRLVSAVLALLLPSLAAAAEPLRPLGGFASFGIAAAPGTQLLKIPVDPNVVNRFAAALPSGSQELEVVGISYPGGPELLIGAAKRPSGDLTLPALAIATGSSNAVTISLDPGAAIAPLTSLGVWRSRDPQLDGVMLIFGFGGADTQLAAQLVQVQPGGGLAGSRVNLGGARSLGGRFELADLDGDGAFELVTLRNLDGWQGGFAYKAVRAYDSARSAYVPAPERFRDFFRGELEFYDWVLTTREAILESPERYMSTQQRAAAFTASWRGQSYGFDSLIPVEDETGIAGGDIAAHNGRVESAVRHIQLYRDELAAWLGGGGFPGVWQLGRQ